MMMLDPRHQPEGVGGGRQGAGHRHHRRRLCDLPSRRAGPQAPDRDGRRRGGGLAGPSAGIARMQELREKFYGGQSYDFSENGLMLGGAALDRREQARRRPGLPAGEPRVSFPEVARRTYQQMSQVHTAKGDKAAARSTDLEKGSRARSEQRPGRRRSSKISRSRDKRITRGAPFSTA